MGSKNLLRYVWEKQIMLQAGYGFSRLHSTSYSLIALQEMNLAHYYPSVYWNTACLTVNAGANEDNENNKSTKYGKIAAAIGNMKSKGIKVSLPDINKADFGFTPDVENNAIIFGLKGIVGIGDDVVREIIKNRPYKSFEDFLVKMFDTKKVQKSHVIQLIKGGCFDSFGDRKEIMKQFIKYIFQPKTKLTMANLKELERLKLIPDELMLQFRFYKFRDYIKKRVYKTIDKPKDKHLILDDISEMFFNEHFSDNSVVDYVDGHIIISEKKFDKEYNEKINKLKEWLSKDETLKLFNKELFNEEYYKNVKGSISQWEMESLSFYHGDHELKNVNNEKYGIVNFFDLPEEPVIEDTYITKSVHEKPIFVLSRIAGTVLDKNKNKHTVTILTTHGVVTLKLYASNYSYYDKQISVKNNDGKKIVIENSWFKRGSKILVTGYRRGNQFIPKVYPNSVYQHSICLIEDVLDNGDLVLKTQRGEI